MHKNQAYVDVTGIGASSPFLQKRIAVIGRESGVMRIGRKDAT
jgi:hypothetical protein